MFKLVLVFFFFFYYHIWIQTSLYNRHLYLLLSCRVLLKYILITRTTFNSLYNRIVEYKYVPNAYITLFYQELTSLNHSNK